MAQAEGNREPNEERRSSEGLDDKSLTGLPDLLRRGLALGLTGFFMTEETVRKALGDALPKDWVDFAAEQSERTRTDFIERMTGELARVLESTDLATIAERLLEGRTLEVKAEIRLKPREHVDKFEFSVKEAGEKA